MEIPEMNSKSSCQLLDRNCVSVIVIWDRFDFHKKLGGTRGEGGSGLKKVLQNISKCVKSILDCEAKIESQSNLSGNQVRKDFVFKTGSEAKDFNLKINESVRLPAKVSMKTFLFSEAELDLKQEPVLTEQDVLHLVKNDHVSHRLQHLFRHFLTCKVVTKDDKILFRFNSVSDVNLFLYNKCRDPSKRTIGLLRENQEQLRLLPDRDGKFSLIVTHEMKSWEWGDWEKTFKFRSKKLGGVRHIQFENKTDLYTFFASEDAKNCDAVDVPKAQLIEDKFNNLELCLKKSKADEQDAGHQLAAKDKELKAAKVDLAKKEAEFDNQTKIIEQLRKELKLKLTKNHKQ